MNMNGGKLKSAALPAIALILAVFSVYYAALGFGFSLSRAFAVITKPGVQNPHCRAVP